MTDGKKTEGRSVQGKIHRLENKDVLDPEDKVLLKSDFPSNSNKSKKNAKTKKPKNIQKITKGKVTKKKKSLGKKFTETFFDGGDLESVSSDVVHNVIVPAIKNLFADTVTNALDMLLFNKAGGGRRGGYKDKTYVNYSRTSGRDREPTRNISKQSRARHNFDEMEFEHRTEAEEVLSHLVDLIHDYGQATVGDLYDLVGIDKAYTDDRYGWVDLSMARILPVRGGFVIGLPKTTLLD